MSTHSIPAGFMKYALASIFIRKVTPTQGVILVGYGGWLIPALRELVGGDFSIEFKSHSPPLRREGQKFRVVISELQGKRT
jgi:hypothetical protein